MRPDRYEGVIESEVIDEDRFIIAWSESGPLYLSESLPCACQGSLASDVDGVCGARCGCLTYSGMAGTMVTLPSE